MIVIPRVLNGLLRELDEETARAVALDFAEQSIREGPRSDIALAEAALSYLAAARAVLAEGDTTLVATAHDAYFAAHTLGSASAQETSWIAVIAVAAACKPQLEHLGVMIRATRYRPTVVDVAQEAQKIAGRRALALHADPVAAARGARWEAARRQLQHLIAVSPPPA
ncbi:hypothetical protein ACFQ6N_17255 [Kitasatospora sp. NPDC056446]|uniref:hypothetical protein n=1 Tax=Kitasatospora sp. NPDC056446 TaxID=3345819 RepID=UPI00367E3517